MHTTNNIELVHCWLELTMKPVIGVYRSPFCVSFWE